MMDADKLKRILDDHAKWRRGEGGALRYRHADAMLRAREGGQ